MSQKSIRRYPLFLNDIRRSCNRIIEYTAGMDEHGFLSNSLVFDAVLRHLTIIGEATKNIPDEVKEQYAGIEWRKVGRFRDHAVHRYFNIQEPAIWDIVHTHVPQMLTVLGPEQPYVPDTPDEAKQ